MNISNNIVDIIAFFLDEICDLSEWIIVDIIHFCGNNIGIIGGRMNMVDGMIAWFICGIMLLEE